MNWMKEAEEKLRRYEAKRHALESIPLEIERLEGDFASIRSAYSDSTPVQGGGSRQEDAMLSNIALREELSRQLESAHAWVELVEKALGYVSDRQKLILDRAYIHPARDWAERLCMELGVDERSVFRYKREALRRFTLALYGALEN